MSVSKSYTISPTFRKAVNRSLVRHTPSDLLYTFGAALYDKANRQPDAKIQQFYRLTVKKILNLVSAVRSAEFQYYVNRK